MGEKEYAALGDALASSRMAGFKVINHRHHPGQSRMCRINKQRK
ncbi:MAG: hypothetical protein VB055_04350 [Oscillospiraceae bacterium]|nr:hypothetical protein [Oscillospiraceae bacterium]